APLLLLLASEDHDGKVRCYAKYLAFRLRISEKAAADAVSGLIAGGFVVRLQDASKPLAARVQSATSEGEGEGEGEAEREREDGASAPPAPRKPRRSRRAADAPSIDIPPSLNHPRFREAWAAWVESRSA